MQLRDEAFVLKTQPLGDADLIVSLLAERHGCVRGVARSARRSRRRFGGSLEPMTRVEAVWTAKDGRDLHRLDQLDGRRSFARMQSDPLCQAVCAVFAEVTEAFSSEGEANEREFRLLNAVLEALEGGTPPLSALRYFEFWTLRLHGLMGDMRRCALCGGEIDPLAVRRVGREDGARCERCRRDADEPGHALSASEAEWWLRLHRPPAELREPHAAARCGGTLERVFRGQLESYAERRFRGYRHVHALAPRLEGTA